MRSMSRYNYRENIISSTKHTIRGYTRKERTERIKGDTIKFEKRTAPSQEHQEIRIEKLNYFAITPIMCVFTVSHGLQNIARAFGGEPIEPGTFRGTEVRRKVHLLLAAHFSERALRSQSSPMGRPKRERKYWWSTDKPLASNPHTTRRRGETYQDSQQNSRSHQ